MRRFTCKGKRKNTLYGKDDVWCGIEWTWKETITVEETEIEKMEEK